MGYFKKFMQLILLSVFLLVSIGAMAKTITIKIDNKTSRDLQLSARAGVIHVVCFWPASVSPDTVSAYANQRVSLTFSDKRIRCKKAIVLSIESTLPNGKTVTCNKMPRFTREASGGSIKVTQTWQDWMTNSFTCEKTS